MGCHRESETPSGDPARFDQVKAPSLDEGWIASSFREAGFLGMTQLEDTSLRRLARPCRDSAILPGFASTKRVGFLPSRSLRTPSSVYYGGHEA